MKTLPSAVLAVALLLALVACGKKEEPAPPPDTVPKVLADEISRRASEAEAQAKQAAAEKDNWKTAFYGLSVVTVLAVLGGVALGSSARRKADGGKRSE